MPRSISVSLFVGLCMTLLAGCTTVGAIEPSASLASGDKSYFVIGVTPAKSRLMIVPGTVVGDQFDSRHRPFESFTMNAPQDGFLVGEGEPGESMALHRIFDESRFPAVGFGPCKTGARVLTFSTVPGAVVYITTIGLERVTGGIEPTYSNDFTGAKNFMKSHYPNLADKLQQGHYQLVIADENCPPLL